jgi:tetratricopeptide (TPR) repeat protein
MKNHFILLIAVMAALCAPALAQFGSVKGVCKDKLGKPLAGVMVEYHEVNTSRTYKLKTNATGEYSSIAILPGQYNVSLMQDGKEIFRLSNITVPPEEKRVDIDLQHEQELAAQKHGMTPDQLRKTEGNQAADQKEAATVKALNEKLLAANQALQAGDLDSATKSLLEATQIEANHTLLWSKLGDVYLDSASKQTSSDEKTTRYTEAADSYQKAIDLKQKDLATRQKTPQDAEDLGHYYNNMAHAQAKSGKVDDAIKSFDQAIQLDPERAAQYYYNLGAILTNAGKIDEAVAAYDKAIAADPKKPDAYYQKGVALIAKATTGQNGKIIPAPGTQEALDKYLELAPTGPYAEGAKGMIQYIGGTVEMGTAKPKK